MKVYLVNTNKGQNFLLEAPHMREAQARAINRGFMGIITELTDDDGKLRDGVKISLLSE